MTTIGGLMLLVAIICSESSMQWGLGGRHHPGPHRPPLHPQPHWYPDLRPPRPGRGPHRPHGPRDPKLQCRRCQEKCDQRKCSDVTTDCEEFLEHHPGYKKDYDCMPLKIAYYTNAESEIAIIPTNEYDECRITTDEVEEFPLKGVVAFCDRMEGNRKWTAKDNNDTDVTITNVVCFNKKKSAHKENI